MFRLILNSRKWMQNENKLNFDLKTFMTAFLFSFILDRMCKLQVYIKCDI